MTDSEVNLASDLDMPGHPLASVALRVLSSASPEVLASIGFMRVEYWEYARESPVGPPVTVTDRALATHRRAVGPWMKMERADG